jgi:pteridine reductase
MSPTHQAALVTGAARRVGKVIALALAGRGMHVMVHYHRSESEAIETAEAVASLGVEAETIQADLGDPAAIERLFDRLKSRFGRLDVLVNNASAFQAKAVLDLTVEDWDHTMNVNLRAPFLCSQQAARLMQNNRSGGVIVNIADIAGQVPWVRFPHHSVSKAGLIMLTKVLAHALAPDIRVNAVVPGPVLKPETMPPERWEQLGAELPLSRPGHPENVAQAVLALIDNDFTTGTIFNVDGGS